MPRPRFHRVLGVAGPTVFYAVLSAWLLWPLPLHAAGTVIDSYRLYSLASTQVFADLLLVMWIMAWECHALVTYPARLFSANAFHPVPHSLALSEHFLGNLPWFAPVYAATGNAVLALNVTMFASYVLAGLSMYWLVRAWTGSRAAGLALVPAQSRIGRFCHGGVCRLDRGPGPVRYLCDHTSALQRSPGKTAETDAGCSGRGQGKK